ncbi:hypothetical protein ACGFX4_13480 [Kitasatospora sp. NPDC048365]|uniref:COG4315 family predicted lipoprotein n=1 Tax=Kitasatospora sp. NPDC048365 TaxID=3364050 RepID=UPI003715579C
MTRYRPSAVPVAAVLLAAAAGACAPPPTLSPLPALSPSPEQSAVSPSAAATQAAQAAQTAAASAAAQASPSASPSATGAGTVVSLVSVGRLGPILVDDQGRTLYLYGADSSTRSTCASDCAEAWPALLTLGDPVAGAGVDEGLLGAAQRGDGTAQVLYKGHPLYRCAADRVSGDTAGQESEEYAGVWYAVNALGDPVRGG